MDCIEIFFEIAFATADYCLVCTVRFILNHRVCGRRGWKILSTSFLKCWTTYWILAEILNWRTLTYNIEKNVFLFQRSNYDDRWTISQSRSFWFFVSFFVHCILVLKFLHSIVCAIGFSFKRRCLDVLGSKPKIETLICLLFFEGWDLNVPL